MQLDAAPETPTESHVSSPERTISATKAQMNIQNLSSIHEFNMDD